MFSSKCVDLKVNRGLIDPNFGGYKLSLDPLPTYSINLSCDVDVARLPDDLYSYQHVKAFGIHNHLYLDEWNNDTVWYVDERWRVQKSVVQDWKLSGPTEMYELPEVANRRLVPQRLNVSLSFTTDNWLALSDGTGRLYLIYTGNRLQNDTWKVGYCDQPLAADIHFTILHSTWHAAGKTACIQVLCLFIELCKESATDGHGSTSVTKLEWLTFHSDTDTTFELSRVRRLEGGTCPNYAAILPMGTGVTMVCENAEKPFSFSYDSVKQVTEETITKAVDEDGSTEVELKPDYTWMQDSDSVTISFRLPAGVGKEDLGFQLKSNSVEITLKDGTTLLTGDLHGTVSVDGSTWIISDNNCLEVHLTKSDAISWPAVVVGDTRGKLLLSADHLDAINDQLEKYCTDVPNAEPAESRKPAFNTEQLEDVDAYGDESSAIWCLDGETHAIVQQVNIGGNQWLFSTSLSAGSMPVVCLRHDVDGLIWQPSTDAEGSVQSFEWKHVGTFNALGYVQASKQQRKFVSCSPSMSYAAIADCVRHVYVYHHPTTIKSPLRNRRTGETIAAVARQQLVSIESTSDILGMCASNTHIFILAGKTLYAVRIGKDE
jgi:hypothetical protein